MATKSAGEDFVTIVPVGECPSPKESAFVTVLTVGAAEGAAEISVPRPRGARLGLGLKFEGGSAAAEKVRRLLVQSCAEDSPAANAITPWGKLIPGDEILAIDGVSVSELTRIDCVRHLKDSDETLKLLVRHFQPEPNPELSNSKSDSKDSAPQVTQMTEISRPTTLPPPVPPRKLGKKNSFKDKHTLQTVSEQNGVLNIDKQDTANGTTLVRKSSFDSHILRQNRENIACLKKGSPEEVRRLVRRLSDGKNMPPQAEVFIDLLSSEWERCLILGDAESDDTGSSISTVVDKLGSMASSVENSIPSTPIMQTKTIDIQKVLNCIENIDSNLLKDITEKRFREIKFKSTDESKISSTENNSRNNSFVPDTKAPITIEKNFVPTKKVQNDKNNNNYIVNDKTASHNGDLDLDKKINDINSNLITDKPKPMPRSTKVERSNSERKSKPIVTLESPVSETLLTPTKKSNIETWLQRSEAEMNGKPVEKYEENHITHGPEALPRLIDFVPKPQFKECSSEPPASPPPPPIPLMRPTAPPPPPPVETREDGSGASLDTIGELDESIDVVDTGKPNETKKDNENKSFDRVYWGDRIHNKSDAEDKSLSNDEIPLPSCPRQPPDGVETPSDAIEKPPDLPSRLPPRLPSTWTSPRPRYSYSRSQDARSEASVKDKIAMFSNDHNVSTDRVDKCGTLPSRHSIATRKSSVTYPELSSLDRRLTKSQDNLDELPGPYKNNTDRPRVLGAVESPPIINNKSQGRVNYSMAKVETKPLFYGSISALASNDSSHKKSIYHSRSISDDSGNKDKDSKSHLEYLIEQRKKSMSKLRGLLIPEVQTPIVDLPEIPVQYNIPIQFQFKPQENNNNMKIRSSVNGKPSTFNEFDWKANLMSNNIPKYSPAFKRKSLQVYSPISLSKEPSPERKFTDKNGILNNTNNKQQRNSMDTKYSFDKTGMANYKSALSNSTLLYKKDFKHILNEIRDYKKQDIKVCTVTDVIDSDNDSAMSSTQSSYRSSASSPMHTLENIESDSSRLSPRIPHYATHSIMKSDISSRPVNNDEYLKRSVCRSVSSDTNISLSSSSGSAATSGSQASCSSLESSVADSDKKKVLKSYNIDTINRRNILASAKCRSGRDAKLKSPVVETKFSHESYDKPPSPTNKTSDPFSTLTSSVSAITNKGENRRRSKVIAETDSDSDSATNIRQRKSEYKNMRLKRNSSSSNKHKSNDSFEPTKIEPARSLTNGVVNKTIKKTTSENEVTLKSVDKQDMTAKVNIKSILPKCETTVNVKTEPVVTAVGFEKIVNDNCNYKEKTEIEECPKDFVDNMPKEEKHVPTLTIRLKRGSGSGVGLILAGGTDCEAKDVTIHRVLSDSVAAKAGLKRGDKIRSINGCSMTGLTHAQSVSVLKDQRSEVEIEVENDKQEKTNGVECGSEIAKSKVRNATEVVNGSNKETVGQVVTVVLEKAGGGAGLGFGLDGGRDSPCGDKPLTIKKLFAGGAAAQSGKILVGAELISAGGQSMEGFTRTQAWAALKSLPAGPVALVLRNP